MNCQFCDQENQIFWDDGDDGDGDDDGHDDDDGDGGGDGGGGSNVSSLKASSCWCFFPTSCLCFLQGRALKYLLLCYIMEKEVQSTK